MSGWEHRLPLPGTRRQLATHCVADLTSFDGSILEQIPLVVGYGAGRLNIFRNEPLLAKLYGDRWPELEPLLTVQIADAYPELLGHKDLLAGEDLVLLGKAEAKLLHPEGEREGPLAVIVMLLLKSKLAQRLPKT